MFKNGIMEYDNWNPIDGLVVEPMNNLLDTKLNQQSDGKELYKPTDDIIRGMKLNEDSKYVILYKGIEHNFCSATCL